MFVSSREESRDYTSLKSPREKYSRPPQEPEVPGNWRGGALNLKMSKRTKGTGEGCVMSEAISM